MKYIIIGCGRTGSGLAQLLSRQGHTVTIVDRSPNAVERVSPTFRGRTITGNTLDREVLIDAGIERSDGLAAVTDSDEANVVVARLAREVFHVPRVVARLFDPLKAEIYQRLGIQVVSQARWGINRVAELLSYSPLHTVLSLGSGQVEVVETEIPQLLAGRTVGSLTVAGEIRVVAIERKGKTFIPTSESLFQKEDVAYIAVHAASANRLRALLELA